ncbi:hypothetical protein ACI7YT_12300 [Microbacterium sp. M]|uniref:hypothetical protein n=1 Tax=Microbacterium sp. M TaxID=3377125 RepID=UPI003862D56C
MTITTALEEAAWVYSSIENYDRQQRFDAAVSLAEWKVFSSRQIARIVGISHSTVAQLGGAKTDKTGGRFDPDSLSILCKLAKRRRAGEALDPAEVAEALDIGTGTSPYMASRLTDIPRMHLIRRYNAAKGAST